MGVLDFIVLLVGFSRVVGDLGVEELLLEVEVLEVLWGFFFFIGLVFLLLFLENFYKLGVFNYVFYWVIIIVVGGLMCENLINNWIYLVYKFI